MTLRMSDDGLQIRFSRSEKVLGLLHDIDVPYTAGSDVEVVPHGLRATTGMRAPGYSWPWSRKLGTWRKRGHKSLIDVRRDQPALRIRRDGQRYDELLVGSDEAERVAAGLRARVQR